MLIVGEFAGIQEYLFESGRSARPADGEACLLRGRSLMVQLLGECAVFRLLEAGRMPRQRVLFHAAGKFAIVAEGIGPSQQQVIRDEHAQIERWLLSRTAGGVQLALAMSEYGGGGLLGRSYELVMANLEREKMRPWATGAGTRRLWEPAPLVIERDGCDQAAIDREIGRMLPASHWLVVRRRPVGAEPQRAKRQFDVLGFDLEVCQSLEADVSGDVVFVTNLRNPRFAPPDVAKDRVGHWPLARHIPAAPNGEPLDFSQIASRSAGRPMLGVLRMDVNSLAAHLSRRLAEAPGINDLRDFSRRLDEFFASELDQELSKPQWESIYTVFSGGDDLLAIGPWDLLLDFAGQAREMFARRFAREAFTMSAGLAIAPVRRPIGWAADEAADLLEEAKTRPPKGAIVPKDQIACMGDRWKWREHGTIIAAGKRLAEAVHGGAAERDWLATLLRFIRARHEKRERRDEAALAAAMLAHHVGCDWPGRNDNDERRRNLRSWGERLIMEFDRIGQTDDPEMLHLPAILRYALLATRGRQEDDSHE